VSARKLSELNAELESDCLWFDCPVCSPTHSIVVGWTTPSPYNAGRTWQLVDALYDSLTLSPSIDCSQGGSCTFHGWVQNGMVRW
jgi:hypothetical protein